MHKRNGLGLLAGLLLMASLVALACTLASLLTLASREQAVCQAQARLRAAAETAALLGLAEAQRHLGADVAHTWAEADGRLGVGRHAERVVLPGAPIAGTIVMRWDIEDLSLRHDLAAGATAALQASAWAKSAAGRPKLPHALPASVTAADRHALAAGGAEFFGRNAEPGTAWQVRGLLTDAERGGWRRNLSADTGLSAELGRPLAEVLRSPAFGHPPARGYPLVCVEDGGRRMSTSPLLTDFRLSLGFFNARSDGRHRLRFHGSAVFWNPLAVPILAGPQGRLFLVEIAGAPEITVTNLESGSTFVTDLDDCPQEDFGLVSQGPRERGLWFWAEVAEAKSSGLAGRGLLPGEVHALVNPLPTLQPQGLSRILTRLTWRLERTPRGPGWTRPSPTIFLPTDRIEIALRFRGKVGVRLRPYAGEPARDALIADYPSKPLLTLENVPFADCLIRTTGEEYSREDSAGYGIEERRACLRTRWRPREATAAWAGVSAVRLSRRHWDWSRAEDAAEWDVDHPVLSAMDVVDHDASPWAGPLWDLRANRHDETEAGAFASVRLADLPGWPSLSVGALRWLEPEGARAWTRLLDRAFYAAPPAVPEAGVVSHQPFLMSNGAPKPADEADAAQGLFVVGPFNVNSRDPAAWEAFLRASTGAWRADHGGPFVPETLQGPLFFTRPSGAGLAKGGALTSGDLSDPSAALLIAPQRESLAGLQSVRRMEESDLKLFARTIVALQADHGWPFPSLRAFADSGLLAKAIESTGLNRKFAGLAPGMPIVLTADDLLEAWAPLLTVRGDTFRLTGRAEGEGGAAACELVIQRRPEVVGPRHLGRRFRINSVRFRNR